MSKEITVIPSESDDLKTEIARLRTELAEALQELTYLCRIECKNIEMHYMMALGVLELKVIDAKCEYLRLRRTLDLMQAKRNRQEPIVEAEIEKELDREFAEYQQTMNKKAHHIEETIKAGQNAQPEGTAAQDNPDAKKLYRKIVKALHPDLNPNVTEAQQSILQQAMEAYEKGDVETLQMISEMVNEPNQSDAAEETARRLLLAERDRLRKALRDAREKIAEVKNTYPYTLKAILDDPVKIEQQREELRSVLKEYEKLIAELCRQIAEIKKGGTDG